MLIFSFGQKGSNRFRTSDINSLHAKITTTIAHCPWDQDNRATQKHINVYWLLILVCDNHQHLNQTSIGTCEGNNEYEAEKT